MKFNSRKVASLSFRFSKDKISMLGKRMNQKISKPVVAAGFLGVIGVMIGAYAAHGLQAYLLKQGLIEEIISKRLSQCDVAVRYHMLHTLAILVLGMNPVFNSNSFSRIAMVFWVLGILLFSGGLYSMVFLGKMGHWAIVPSGGLCFVLGWASIIIVGLKTKHSSSSH